MTVPFLLVLAWLTFQQFLDSVLSSLQTGKPSSGSLSQSPAPPASSSVAKKDDKKPATANLSGNVNGGIKRKADDQLSRPARPDSQVAGKPAGPRPVAPYGTAKTVSKPGPATNAKPASPKPVAKNKDGATTTSMAAPTKAVPTKPASTSASAPVQSKPPPKGSYAEIMARAKALQTQAPQQVGMLRHQAVPKERLSKVERKRRMMEAKAQEKAGSSGRKVTPPTAGVKGKTAGKRATPEEPAYKGTAKPSKVPEEPAYRGTAGLPASRRSKDRRANGKRRMDEYLGTDEEDEGDYGGYDDHYSDESSDMEAGFDDVEEEEGVALKSARKEDEEELRMEIATKKAKLERQKKLAALASRGRR